MQEIQPFGENIWIVDGPNVRDMGLLFTTRMTIVKLSDGSVWVESPVTLPAETLQQITRLGTIRYIVSSTQRHIWRLKEWHSLFPQAQLWAPQTSSFALGRDMASVSSILTDVACEGWARDMDQLIFKGSHVFIEALFYHRSSRTVIMGDLIQANPMLKGRFIRNGLFRLSGAAAPKGGVGFDIRRSFRNRVLARQSLEQLLTWDFDKLIIAHGNCVQENAKAYVKEAFQWL